VSCFYLCVHVYACGGEFLLCIHFLFCKHVYFVLKLQVKYAENPDYCSFENMAFRETLKGGIETPIVLAVQNGKVVLKNSGEAWTPPEKGFIKFNFQQAVAVPTLNDAIDPKSHDTLMKIVEAGKDSEKKKDVDKKRIWLHLLCQDVYFTTEQVNAFTLITQHFHFLLFLNSIFICN
jgi:hypothetical protein